MLLGRGINMNRSSRSSSNTTCQSQNSIQIITIIDPAHPLHGKSFKVIKIHISKLKQSVVTVEYKRGIPLKIPLECTNLRTYNNKKSDTKLNNTAIAELVELANECLKTIKDGRKMSGRNYPPKSGKRSSQS